MCSINTHQTCCLTGHRIISAQDSFIIKQRLVQVVLSLVESSIFSFQCGGALGFDMLAAFTILDLKRKIPELRLRLVLPCHDQDARWPQAERAKYRELIKRADDVFYVSEIYYDGCMKKRNLYMVQTSGTCVAYMRNSRSGTGQTVRLAQQHKLVIFNVAYPSNDTIGNDLE